MVNFKKVCHKCSKRTPDCHSECPEYVAEDIIYSCILDEEKKKKKIKDNLDLQRRKQVEASNKRRGNR